MLDGSDLSTVIGVGTGDASFDANGRPLYRNRRQVKYYEHRLEVLEATEYCVCVKVPCEKQIKNISNLSVVLG